jgi:hypothetical protein
MYINIPPFAMSTKLGTVKGWSLLRQCAVFVRLGVKCLDSRRRRSCRTVFRNIPLMSGLAQKSLKRREQDITQRAINIDQQGTGTIETKMTLVQMLFNGDPGSME